MGLDSIEILMKVEKTFNINIPDEEAEKIITVRDFHNCVWRHLEGNNTDKCKSQSLFYKLRKSFVEVFGLPKSDFKMETSLNNIFPTENRRQNYFAFSTTIDLKLPDLILTKPWRAFLNSIAILTVLGGLGLSIIFINFSHYSKWTLLIPVGGIMLTNFISKILNSRRTIIKPELVRDFTQEILSLNYVELTKDIGTNRKEVEYIINHIISDMAGLELDEVEPEKKIHDDLGID